MLKIKFIYSSLTRALNILNVQILLKLPKRFQLRHLTTARTNSARLALPPKWQLQNMQHSAYQVWSLALTGHRKYHFCHKWAGTFLLQRSTPGFLFPKKILPSHRERRYYRPGNPFFSGVKLEELTSFHWWYLLCLRVNTMYICIYARRQRATTKQLYCVLNIGKHCIVT